MHRPAVHLHLRPVASQVLAQDRVASGAVGAGQVEHHRRGHGTRAQRAALLSAPRLGPLDDLAARELEVAARSEEHTSELQSLMRISYAVFCLKKKKHQPHETTTQNELRDTKINIQSE